MENIFPIRLYATDIYYASSPKLAESIWVRLKRTEAYKSFTWYATDCEITSPEHVKLFVYEIGDSFRGGIGKCIQEIEVTKFTVDEWKMITKHILLQQTISAEAEFIRREEMDRNKKIESIRQEMFQ